MPLNHDYCSCREKLSKEKSSSKPKASRLAPDPKPSTPAPEPTSAINVVILFDVADAVCLKRSAGRYGESDNNTSWMTLF